MIGSVIRILAAFAAAFFTGKAVSRLKLPSILGWLIAGMVLGPHGVNLLDNALLNSGPYTAMTHIFECAVGLMIGTELVWKRIRKSGKSITGIRNHHSGYVATVVRCHVRRYGSHHYGWIAGSLGVDIVRLAGGILCHS